MRARHARTAGCLALALAVGSSSARAEEPIRRDPALAEALFREGRALLEAGDAPRACEKLSASYRLDPHLGTLMNLAACHQMEGRLAQAWAEFLEAARLARGRTTPDAKKLEETARERAAQLEPKLQRVQIDVASPRDDLTIKLDGLVLPPGAWRTPLPVDPGSHEIEARQPRHTPYRARFTIERGKGDGHVVIPVLSPEPVAQGAGPRPPTTRASSRLGSPWFLGAAAITLVAGGTGTFFGLRTLEKMDERDRLCTARGCPSDGLTRQEEAFAASNVATALFAVALAGAITSVAVLVWPRGKAAQVGSAASALTGAMPL